MQRKIHCAFSTYAVKNASASHWPVLVIRGDNQDIVHHSTEVKSKLEVGNSSLITLDISSDHQHKAFDEIRIGMLGADWWYPNTVFVFEEFQEDDGSIHTHPMALRKWAPSSFNLDITPGALLLPVELAALGNSDTELDRILILVKNDKGRYSGTKSKVTVEIKGRKNTILEYTIPTDGIKKAGATFLTVVDLEEKVRSHEIASIQLHIGGKDKWTPSALWMYGIDHQPNNHERVVPLVNISDWAATGLGSLSKDAKEGESCKLLYKAYR